jgi:hypothetical protein
MITDETTRSGYKIAPTQTIALPFRAGRVTSASEAVNAMPSSAGAAGLHWTIRSPSSMRQVD